MIEYATQIGVGGVFVLLTLQMVFNFLKPKKSTVVKFPESIEKSFSSVSKKIHEMHEMKQDINKSIRQTDELYRWHNVTDQNGTPVWYVKQDLGKSVDKLADAINKFAIVQERTAERLLQNENDHKRIENKLDKVLEKTA